MCFLTLQRVDGNGCIAGGPIDGDQLSVYKQVEMVLIASVDPDPDTFTGKSASDGDSGPVETDSILVALIYPA
ncbi:hypothetical protein SDC9_130575 [bioreactor metagenome]|uniref:Uncharacterized protein n=1 Tax=bioreactor metagenome TaxID=1076179 RepID=A0A645D2Y4_9ZZZZ